MNNGARTVLAIDPGRSKCGVAVVRADESAGLCRVLFKAVEERSNLCKVIVELKSRFNPEAIIMGNGTGCKDICEQLDCGQDAPLVVVDEQFSTLRARKRFFLEHPPRGLYRLVPQTMLTPYKAYDDYVAVMLAETYLASL